MRKFAFFTFLLASIVILLINIKLHIGGETKADIKEDIILQLHFLEDELKEENLGERMQHLFPEGKIFINATYGLAWIELALAFPNDSTLLYKATNEALFSYKQIDENSSKWYFETTLNPEYGIFYNAWRNYLLAKILSTTINLKERNIYEAIYESQCDKIATALSESNSPYLESYVNQAWPADMFVAMASLSIHDKIMAPKYHDLIKQWTENVQTKLDIETGLIPHKVNAQTGTTIEGARGCSIALMLRMLAEIDTNFANSQYSLMEEQFLGTRFGLPAIMEYPKGKSGWGDVDSGPVIFGVGFSGTITAIGTYAVNNQAILAEQQYRTINAFGFGFKSKKEKKYLLGYLPMADSFIAWGRATALHYSSENIVAENWWTLKFHLISLVIITLIWLIYFKKEVLTKINSRK